MIPLPIWLMFHNRIVEAGAMFQFELEAALFRFKQRSPSFEPLLQLPSRSATEAGREPLLFHCFYVKLLRGGVALRAPPLAATRQFTPRKVLSE